MLTMAVVSPAGTARSHFTISLPLDNRLPIIPAFVASPKSVGRHNMRVPVTEPSEIQYSLSSPAGPRRKIRCPAISVAV